MQEAIMREVRTPGHEAAELEPAGGRSLGMTTSWGDGILEVDRAAAGAPVAERVGLDSDERPERIEERFAP